MDDDESAFSRDWEGLAGHVRREGSELVLLPEMPFSGWFAASPKFDRDTWERAVASHMHWMGRLCELAPAAVLGTRPVNRKALRLNEGFLWREGRGAVAVHQKSYLPEEAGFHEARWYHRGDGRFSPFGVSGCRVGMMICSDLWAMPHARAYGKKGAHIIAVPFAAPASSIERWLAGGKVAAFISGAFCIASNRAGQHDGVKFGGTGWVIGPEGGVMGTTTRSEPFVTLDIDLREAEAAKKTYPRDALRPD